MARSQDRPESDRQRKKTRGSNRGDIPKGRRARLRRNPRCVEGGEKAGMPIAPGMIYGDDVSHVVTEEGIAYLYKAEGIEERRRALAAVAGISPIGLRAKPQETAELRKRGIVAYPEDIGVHRLQATRSLLAARS